VEFDPPMPLQLTADDMRQWLRSHGRLTECSQSFHSIDPQDAEQRGMPLRADSVWSAAYRQYLDEVAKQHFSCDNLRVTLPVHGRTRDFLTSFDGVIEAGQLVRIWGVARDVTELSDLNSRLLREQERLRSYARQIVTADERARRATAVDLHDGIGQSLVSVCMNLDVARKQAPPDLRLLLDEMKVRLADVQERTNGVISDLSPPGLYDMGLVPALQWLVVRTRTHDKLHAELDCQIKEEMLTLDLRILTFKLVRELLRNVVKHAAVRAARIKVGSTDELLIVEVSDEGRGFEWQLDMFGARSGGFGLWSMADRVADVGGTFAVDTAPGRGARFELRIPLRSVTERTRHDYGDTQSRQVRAFS
jgi:signal transduction histidine kinase